MPTDREMEIAGAVGQVFDWIDSQISQNPAQCRECGKCCDFQSYDHRLFVTSCELIYFVTKLKSDKIKPMSAGRCPYNTDGKCTVYPFRFAGCRIFFCRGDEDFQRRLSEQASEKFKAICEEFGIPYSYTDLPTAFDKATI